MGTESELVTSYNSGPRDQKAEVYMLFSVAFLKTIRMAWGSFGYVLYFEVSNSSCVFSRATFASKKSTFGEPAPFGDGLLPSTIK